jgi:ProP effector
MTSTPPSPEEPSAAPAADAAAPTAPSASAEQLKTLFPALFGAPPKPLKLRIQADIQDRAPGLFSKQVLSAFLRRYTGSTAYLLAVSKSSHRFDLDGQPAGELSAEHRQLAADELARRRAVHEDRRRLEQQQRRNRAGLLHDFEITTLTTANFCALKGVAPDELDGLLALARAEAQEDAARPAPPWRGARPRR